jgi:hypothetical protein
MSSGRLQTATRHSTSPHNVGTKRSSNARSILMWMLTCCSCGGASNSRDPEASKPRAAGQGAASIVIAAGRWAMATMCPVLAARLKLRESTRASAGPAVGRGFPRELRAARHEAARQRNCDQGLRGIRQEGRGPPSQPHHFGNGAHIVLAAVGLGVALHLTQRVDVVDREPHGAADAGR